MEQSQIHQKNLKKKYSKLNKTHNNSRNSNGSMFEKHTHENETHTHGRIMGHKITAMEKKKIE